LICLSHEKYYQIEAFNKIKEAVNSGDLSLKTLNQRVAKVLEYKEDMDLSILDREYREVDHIVENKDTKKFSYEVVKKAVTLIRGKAFVKKGKTLVIAVRPSVTTIADESSGSFDVISIINRSLKGFDTLDSHVKPTPKKILEAVALAKDYNQVVVCTYNANIYKSQLDLVNEINKLDLELYVMAMRNPYDFIDDPKILNYVCFYEYTPNSVDALIELLQGKLELSGKVPITYE